MDAFGMRHHDCDAAGRGRQSRHAEGGAVGVKRILLSDLVFVVHESCGDQAGVAAALHRCGVLKLRKTFAVGGGDGDH